MCSYNKWSSPTLTLFQGRIIWSQGWLVHKLEEMHGIRYYVQINNVDGWMVCMAQHMLGSQDCTHRLLTLQQEPASTNWTSSLETTLEWPLLRVIKAAITWNQVHLSSSNNSEAGASEQFHKSNDKIIKCEQNGCQWGKVSTPGLVTED